MKKPLIILVILIVLVFVGLQFQGPTGTWVLKNNQFTIDTLVVNDDGTYIRNIYRKSDNKLLFHKESTYIYEDRRVRFSEYYENYDDEHEINENRNRENVLLTYSCYVDVLFWKTTMGYNHINVKPCHTKVYFE